MKNKQPIRDKNAVETSLSFQLKMFVGSGKFFYEVRQYLLEELHCNQYEAESILKRSLKNKNVIFDGIKFSSK